MRREEHTSLLTEVLEELDDENGLSSARRLRREVVSDPAGISVDKEILAQYALALREAATERELEVIGETMSVVMANMTVRSIEHSALLASVLDTYRSESIRVRKALQSPQNGVDVLEKVAKAALIGVASPSDWPVALVEGLCRDIVKLETRPEATTQRWSDRLDVAARSCNLINAIAQKDSKSVLSGIQVSEIDADVAGVLPDIHDSQDLDATGAVAFASVTSGTLSTGRPSAIEAGTDTLRILGREQPTEVEPIAPPVARALLNNSTRTEQEHLWGILKALVDPDDEPADEEDVSGNPADPVRDSGVDDADRCDDSRLRREIAARAAAVVTNAIAEGDAPPDRGAEVILKLGGWIGADDIGRGMATALRDSRTVVVRPRLLMMLQEVAAADITYIEEVLSSEEIVSELVSLAVSESGETGPDADEGHSKDVPTETHQAALGLIQQITGNNPTDRIDPDTGGGDGRPGALAAHARTLATALSPKSRSRPIARVLASIEAARPGTIGHETIRSLAEHHDGVARTLATDLCCSLQGATGEQRVRTLLSLAVLAREPPATYVVRGETDLDEDTMEYILAAALLKLSGDAPDRAADEVDALAYLLDNDSVLEAQVLACETVRELAAAQSKTITKMIGTLLDTALHGGDVAQSLNQPG